MVGQPFACPERLGVRRIARSLEKGSEMLRSLSGGIVGIVAGMVVNIAFVIISWGLYPPPAGADLNDAETLAAYVASLPLPALLLTLAAHLGGAFVGGLVASAVAGRRSIVLGAVVGGFFLVGGIANLVSIPAPLWFAVVDLIGYLPCGIAGASLVGRGPGVPSTTGVAEH